MTQPAPQHQKLISEKAARDILEGNSDGWEKVQTYIDDPDCHPHLYYTIYQESASGKHYKLWWYDDELEGVFPHTDLEDVGSRVGGTIRLHEVVQQECIVVQWKETP